MPHRDTLENTEADHRQKEHRGFWKSLYSGFPGKEWVRLSK